jgi:hypothetical protein
LDVKHLCRVAANATSWLLLKGEEIITHLVDLKPPLGALGVKNREKKEVWGIKLKIVRFKPPKWGVWGVVQEKILSSYFQISA